MTAVNRSGGDDRGLPSSTGEDRWVFTRHSIVAEDLRPARHGLAQWATGVGVPTERVHDVILAVSEALSNTIEHAYPATPGPVWVQAVRTVGQIRITVTDHGQWRIPGRDPGFRGRGLALIHALADHCHVEHGDGATTVTMVWIAHSTP